jgi:hypothetical protein
MCPQLPRLSPEYSHKAGLQTVITGMPLQIRPATRGGYAGPVTMGRIARGPLSWTRPHCGMPSSSVFVWCRSSEGCPCLLCVSEQRLSSGDFERRVAFLPSPQQATRTSGMRKEPGGPAASTDVTGRHEPFATMMDEGREEEGGRTDVSILGSGVVW